MFPQSTVTEDTFHCRVGIIDALGKIILYGHTIPYNTDFNGFLEQLSMAPFHPLLRIGDHDDYASWAKRLEFLSSDKAAIAKLELLIEQHKTTDYEKLAEWLWVCGDGDSDSGGKLITGETEFNAFMALAKSKKLGQGCLMRVSLQKHHHCLLPHITQNEQKRPFMHDCLILSGYRVKILQHYREAQVPRSE